MNSRGSKKKTVYIYIYIYLFIYYYLFFLYVVCFNNNNLFFNIKKYIYFILFNKMYKIFYIFLNKVLENNRITWIKSTSMFWFICVSFKQLRAPAPPNRYRGPGSGQSVYTSQIPPVKQFGQLACTVCSSILAESEMERITGKKLCKLS